LPTSRTLFSLCLSSSSPEKAKSRF
jgi:hypothetical protein